MPIIIHCREAWCDTLKIIKEFYATQQKLNGVAHFFSGTSEDAYTLFDLGFLVSFTGVITFAKDYSKVIKEIPLEKIMIETDSPYVAPVPYRGSRNTPLYVTYVAKTISEIKKIPLKTVAETTTKNAQKLFNIN